MNPLSFAKLGLATLIALALATTTSFAADGELTPQAVTEIRSTLHMDDHTRAMTNAITGNDIKLLSLNHDLVQQHNDIFNHKIKTSAVTNQLASGRCWLFAALNVLRPDLLQKHKAGKFEFSQTYLAFWDKMEKANTFLEDIIELSDRDMLDRDLQVVLTRASLDDGWWDYVPALIKKYGAVPQEVMSETHSSSNTAAINAFLRCQLKIEAVKIRKMSAAGKSVIAMRAAKQKALAEIYRILVMNLGEPPTDFQWRFEDKDSKVSTLQSYTPQSFWKEWVGEVKLEDYVQLGNHPGQKYGRLYRIDHSRNVCGTPDVQYVNVNIDVLKAAALKSVLDGQPVWFAADVGKDQEPRKGIMATDVHDYGSIFGNKEKLTKAQRLSYLDGGPTHAMVLMGVDLQKQTPVKWLVENSWGKERGHDGYWSLYDNWFNDHLYLIVVKKSYVPEAVLAQFQQKPILLPRWHPMAQLSD